MITSINHSNSHRETSRNIIPYLSLSLDNHLGDNMDILLETELENEFNKRKTSFLMREKDLFKVTFNMEEKKIALGS